jgi:hypothetical protein
MRGLHVSVYRTKIGSLGGELSGYSYLTLIDPDRELGTFKPNKQFPAVYLKKHGNYLYATPSEDSGQTDELTPWMASGTFIYTDDSRFPSRQPIALHDRRETWSNCHLLSR